MALTLFLRAFLQNSFTVFDLIATFNIAILGIYLLLVIYIGARYNFICNILTLRTDAILKSHVKILYLQQWKLRQKLQLTTTDRGSLSNPNTPLKKGSEEFLRRYSNSPNLGEENSSSSNANYSKKESLERVLMFLEI